jgi:hypothetical protein
LTYLEINAELFAIARRNNITITNIAGDVYDPDVAFTSMNVINMNPAYESKYSYAFRLAHEIGHIVECDEDAQEVYLFSPLGKSEAEIAANHYAIKTIFHMVCDDIPYEHRNWLSFMGWLGLPAEFEGLVKDALADKF